MWSSECQLNDNGVVVHSTCHLIDLFASNPAYLEALNECTEPERWHAIADFVARRIQCAQDPQIQTLELSDVSSKKWNKGSRKARRKKSHICPLVLERTDIFCNAKGSVVHVTLHVATDGTVDVKQRVDTFLSNLLSGEDVLENMMRHVACVVLQNRLRAYLESKKWIAFVANGSILPRKSGATAQPMASPPAVAFQSPKEYQQTIVVSGMRKLKQHLLHSPQIQSSAATDDTAVEITGMVVSAGITLIVGGGYHGKSTLLRTIAAGVYDMIPGDGREYCVTVRDAVSVRAEDGRYVNNCNVSAFISQLPTTTTAAAGAVDTKQFSSRDASGSTSQAANVSEAVEMGAKALLVDEDVSAANFMARDGRMRALVMDESITPLLYRVNGLYDTHGISSIVVVGGVGDWLDVAHRVLLLDKYVTHDATAKAQSISRQFSYGHVQYAGRGVVHRLPWEKEGTPLQRRPTPSTLTNYTRESTFDDNDDSMAVFVEVADGGGHVFTIERPSHGNNDDDDDDDGGVVDMTRCEQLLGRKPQLVGCGLCLRKLLQLCRDNPGMGVGEGLTQLEEHLSRHGMQSLLGADQALLVVAVRPRRHEVFMALTRLRGLALEPIPASKQDNEMDTEALKEAQRRKQELAQLWSNRRGSKKRFA